MCRWCYTCDSTFCCFFYFQAEDGIRDLYVTGVQTCALPISQLRGGGIGGIEGVTPFCPPSTPPWAVQSRRWHSRDRKSTRLNSSHVEISYAVFCLKKKKTPPRARHSRARLADQRAITHAVGP